MLFFERPEHAEFATNASFIVAAYERRDLASQVAAPIVTMTYRDT